MNKSREEHAYSDATYKEFKRLVWLTSSPQQMDRIEARMNMSAFIATHGKDMCDDMFRRINKEED